MSDARFRTAAAALSLVPAALTLAVVSPARAATGSASLDAGVLKVFGADVALDVLVAPDPAGLAVTVSGGGAPIGQIQGCTWDAAVPETNICSGVTSISVLGSPAADTVSLDPAVTQPLTADGGGGNDVLTGGAGNDVLTGGLASDRLDGAGGDDVLRPNAVTTVRWSDTLDVVRGGLGSDRVLYSGYPADTQYLAVSLDDKVNDGEGGEGDNIGADVEDVTVSGLKAAKVAVSGTADANKIYVSDVLSGIVIGGAGDDTLVNTGDTNGTNSSNPDGSATTYGGDGDDFINARGSIAGDAGADRILGTDGVEGIFGGPGADQIQGMGGNDSIDTVDDFADAIGCGAGADVVRVNNNDSRALDCETVAVPAPVVVTPADGASIPVSSTGLASIPVTNKLTMTTGAKVIVKNALLAQVGTATVAVAPNGSVEIKVQLNSSTASAVASRPTSLATEFVLTANGKTVRVNHKYTFTAAP